MVSGAPWQPLQPLQPLPLPASARCQPEELPWEGWEAVSAMIQIYIWYVVAGEFARFMLPGHDAWLSQMWLAQLLTYFLSWMSLQPLLRRLPSQHLRKMIDGRVTGRHLAFGLALALLLGFLTAPVGRGHLLPSASTVLHGELRAVQHLAASRSLGGVAGLFLLVGVVAPTFEELLFRGFLLIALRRSSSPIFLSSFLFGFFHCHPNSHSALLGFRPLLPTAVLGAWFAYFAVKTGSLTTSILLHQFWNGGHVLLVAILTWMGTSPWLVDMAVSCYA